MGKAWAAEESASPEEEHSIVTAVTSAFGSELREVRLHMGSELSQSSAACTQALRRSEADLGSLRDELADIAGDGIELRRQVLALCTQSSEDRAEVAALPGIGEEES